MTTHLMVADLGSKSGVLLIGPVDQPQHKVLLLKSFRMLASCLQLEGVPIAFVDGYTVLEPDGVKIQSPTQLVTMAIEKTELMQAAMNEAAPENMIMIKIDAKAAAEAGEAAHEEIVEQGEEHNMALDFAKHALADRLDGLIKLKELYMSVGLT